ncbi:hypothetical protein Tsp_07091 [Trichinella spiralis]|uniref:hypothetical protein n=1 Tax=Trichinella spiralis TaxID=6334 RepID=UPI0001EFB983|nr:hypothetical protein Tsp_07091 [Trichinella spiralis]
MELHLAKFNGEKVKHARPYRKQKPTNAKNQVVLIFSIQLYLPINTHTLLSQKRQSFKAVQFVEMSQTLFD